MEGEGMPQSSPGFLWGARAAIGADDNLVPFRHRVDTRLDDPPKGDTPWLDWLRAEPWVPVVED